ncbi:MAG: alkane 1-monooxygenase [Gammaproteobacteria bacterium]|uniref:alkane 1-monooxygenase n=1 Tax=Rhodoferax sp. TaxID=50421 RepID=UPI0017CC36B5|nr:alkane 1-monooxygenase [Rhodoferax sp.]MBU3898401.1 alkane 1-monooxygenase [Gammaproteobacteria bacterium]MBA3059335.1 alkane 1-monooxygenase [Rhodoferax sp.]MBU3998120.1 alkane 1-monooxygenase [Gammaproteobacteria bacterium]MBU4079175.1 alkane 1-monooxygenase [Gammaproteobacteria bacterium]MBU4113760.1 alkane 1-monooxygenase [Gammaproteobacteria bacterium]
MRHSPSPPEVQASPAAPPYRDRKRYAWLLSLLVPATVVIGPALMLASGDVRALWIPAIFFYIVAPLLDWLLGEDLSNPPESAVPALDADRYYRRITYALVPVLWAAFIFSAWFVGTHALPWHGLLAMVLITGSVGGFSINLGHELGHKNTKLERWLAKLILAPTAYGHFFIEHNRGHHRDVATPLDPASSRMGESIYHFVGREMPGAFKRAWKLESDRLQRVQLPLWSLHNEILQPALITLLLWGTLLAWLGIGLLPFLLIASFWANFQLTSANYIEHYGLLRQLRAPGKYEICQPHHSWNSNHIFSNWALFHLQRHSDHHAHPLRRYQSLRHFENLPRLPSGYFGMFTVAYIPALWRYVMNERLLGVVGRDASRINLDPRQRAALIRRYGLQDTAQAKESQLA